MLVSKSTPNKVNNVPANQKLPPQYEAQFKQVIKFYEARQYKKALKSIDGILREHPNHGETISLKGLVLSSLDPAERSAAKAEKTPTEYAKLGLSKHLNSYLCWQVFGLIHRSERNYREAVSCFRQATRHDPENIQLLRDLAMLQTQTRDYTGLLDTRNKMLAHKPTIKLNWIGLAVAHYLCGNGEVAYHILEAFEKATAVTESPIQISELQLFKVQSLTRAGMWSEALECIARVQQKVMDLPVLLALRAECEMKVGKRDEAAETFFRILESNLEDWNAVRGYVASQASFPVAQHRKVYHELTDAQRAEILRILDTLNARLEGKSHLVQRECLDVCTPEQLRPRFVAFAQPYIRKNIPSLYSAVKSLYLRVELWSVMESVLLEWYGVLTKHGRFEEEVDAATLATPTALLWLLIMLAHHYCRVRNYELAWKYLEEAIAHSPTMEHLYALKAKILKHQGDASAAAHAMKEAREMDLADRYLTNRTVKYLLRANQLDEAAVLYAYFSRANVGAVLGNAIDFQAMWFELEVADSCYRQGAIDSALSLYLVTENHFQEFYEDQVDFHGYCLRKYTLRAYMDLLECSDQYARHPIYRRTAKRIILCYLALLDRAAAHTPPLDDIEPLRSAMQITMPVAMGDIAPSRLIAVKTNVVALKEEALRVARRLEAYDVPRALRPPTEITDIEEWMGDSAQDCNDDAAQAPTSPSELLLTLLLILRVYLHHDLLVLAMRHAYSAARIISDLECRKKANKGDGGAPKESVEWESTDCSKQAYQKCLRDIQDGVEAFQAKHPGDVATAMHGGMLALLATPEIQQLREGKW